MGDEGCSCSGKCSDHAALEKQLEGMSEMPGTVNRLTGIVSVIAGLFALLVGLAFNSHFEQIAQDEKMNKKFDTLGTKMVQMADMHNESKTKLSERLARIETRIQDAHRRMDN